jgi:hypothetical protein
VISSVIAPAADHAGCHRGRSLPDDGARSAPPYARRSQIRGGRLAAAPGRAAHHHRRHRPSDRTGVGGAAKGTGETTGSDTIEGAAKRTADEIAAALALMQIKADLIFTSDNPRGLIPNGTGGWRMYDGGDTGRTCG